MTANNLRSKLLQTGDEILIWDLYAQSLNKLSQVSEYYGRMAHTVQTCGVPSAIGLLKQPEHPSVIILISTAN